MYSGNPYHSIARINDPKLFFNRDELIENILNSLLSYAPQSHSIVGQRKIGKTSLVTHLYRPATFEAYGFATRRNCFFVYFDCQLRAHALESTEGLFRELLQHIRDEALSQLSPVPQGLVGVVYENVYKEWDRIFEVLQANKLRMIIIFDEFERAIFKKSLFDGNFFGMIRGYAQSDVFAYIACTNRRLDILFDEAFEFFSISKVIQNSSSDFFNVAVTNYVRLFSEQDALALIRNPSQRLGIEFTIDEIKKILYFGGHFPFFVQRACYHFFMHHQRGRADLDKILETCLNEATPFWSRYWNKLTSEQQELLLAVAHEEYPNSTIYEVEQLKAISLIYEANNGRLSLFSSAFARFIKDINALANEKSHRLNKLSDGEKTGVILVGNIKDESDFDMVASLKMPRIGIVTALPKEYAAVKVMLDKPKEHFVPSRGDMPPHRYIIGEIPSANNGTHFVVLTRTSDIGNNSAASRATFLLEHFPHVQLILMVGIAGGIPHPAKPSKHVRLGDIVISNHMGIIQYDFTKEELYKTGELKIENRHRPRPPSAYLLQVLGDLEANELTGERPWLKYIERANKLRHTARPDVASDILVSSDDPAIQIVHPFDPDRVEGQPRVFIGPIASSSTLQKNPLRRDNLRDIYGVMAVEMEGAGIADGSWELGANYLVIRGICDYCDSRKNDEWQGYASVVAATFTRALLEAIPTIPIAQ